MDEWFWTIGLGPALARLRDAADAPPDAVATKIGFRTVAGVRIRCAECGGGMPQSMLMTSPWPESMYAFAPIWDALAQHFHVVAPDVGTAAALFAAAGRPGLFSSVVVGGGGAAVPLRLTGPLAEWVHAPDLERSSPPGATGSCLAPTPSSSTRAFPSAGSWTSTPATSPGRRRRTSTSPSSWTGRRAGHLRPAA